MCAVLRDTNTKYHFGVQDDFITKISSSMTTPFILPLGRHRQIGRASREARFKICSSHLEKVFKSRDNIWAIKSESFLQFPLPFGCTVVCGLGIINLVACQRKNTKWGALLASTREAPAIKIWKPYLLYPGNYMYTNNMMKQKTTGKCQCKFLTEKGEALVVGSQVRAWGLDLLSGRPQCLPASFLSFISGFHLPSYEIFLILCL